MSSTGILTRRTVSAAFLLGVLVGGAPGVAAQAPLPSAGPLPRSDARSTNLTAEGEGWIVELKLDDTGIASWKFLNQRNPPHLLKDTQDEVIDGVGAASAKDQAASFVAWLRGRVDGCDDLKPPSMATAPWPEKLPECPLIVAASSRRKGPLIGPTADPRFSLRIRNRSSIRDMVVTLAIPLAKGGEKDCQRQEQTAPTDQTRVDRGLDAGGRAEAFWEIRKEGECTLTARVDASSHVDVDAWQVARVMGLRGCNRDVKTGAVRIVVDPYDQETKLPRASGSFVLIAPWAPVADGSSWRSSLTAGPVWETGQEIGTNDKGEPAPLLYTRDKPYRDQRLQHFPSTGFLTFSQNLADRAAGSVTLGVKSNDFGSDPTVSVNEYRFTVWGMRGFSLDAGKFEFAKPTAGIVGSQAGEGARVNLGFAEIGYIVQRESADGKKPEVGNRDRSAWVFQAKGIPGIPRVLPGGIEGLSFYGTEGMDRCVTKDPKTCPATVKHRILGGELGFGLPKSGFGGTIAVYRTKQWGAPMEGRGTVGLFTGNYTRARRAKANSTLEVRFSATFRYGFGTADDPDTPEINEGYVGEGKTALPGVVFPALIDRLNTGGTGSFGPGLSNKSYWGAEFKYRRFSPLRWIVSLFGRESDIASESMTGRVHSYRLREPVLGNRGVGREIELGCDIESPKGVRWNLSFASFQPDSHLQPFLASDPWTISGSIVIATGR